MIFRKYISSLLLATLITAPVAITYSDNASQDLGDYSEHAQKFDTIVERLSTEKLTSTAKKINIISQDQSGDSKAFMDYIMQSIKKELEERQNNIPTIHDSKVLQEEEKDILSDKEKLKVEQEVLGIQNTLMEEIISFTDSNIALLHNLTSYEEKGDFSATADFQVENFMKFKGNLDISQYISEVQLFDQSFDGRIDLDYMTSIFDQDIDISLGTHLNFITKDGGAYIIFKDTSVTSSDESIELEITPFIEKLEKLSEENTYLSLVSGDNAAAIKILESINIESIRGEMEKIFSKALFEAYEKKGDGYLLKPSRHLCDIGKELTQVFDPFGGKTCSDKQYSKMVDDLLDTGFEMLLQTGKSNSLSITFPTVNAYETVDINISWRENNLTSLGAGVYYTEDPEIQFMNFEYIPKRHLSFHIPKGDDNIEISLLVDIDRKGEISSGDMYMQIEDDFTMNGTYENHQLEIRASGGDAYTYFTCESNGELRNKFADIKATCSVLLDGIAREIASDSETLELNAEISYDGRNNKNNLLLNFDAELDTNNYARFDISNIGTRRSIAKSEIIAPKNTKDITQFMSDIYSDLFFNLSPGGDDFGDYSYEDYTYETQEFDDHTQECYIYDSGNTTCYKTYNDKYITCEYLIETESEECDTYEYGYVLEESETENGTKTCYTYDSGDRDCYEYTDEATISCNYIAETDSEDCIEDNYSDWEYTYETQEFDDHTQECYIYDSGNTTCYKTYNDKYITCEYLIETESEECDTYEYGYVLEEFETENGTKTCYTYDSGDRDCYEYTDEVTISCNYIAETDSEDCIENNYSDWYDNGE